MQSMGSQTVGHDWVTALKRTELNPFNVKTNMINCILLTERKKNNVT